MPGHRARFPRIGISLGSTMEIDQQSFYILSLIFLLIYRAYLRQLPTGFANLAILRAVEEAANDKEFRDACIDLCKMNEEQTTIFDNCIEESLRYARQQLRAAVPAVNRQPRLPMLTIMQLGLMRGGWIGLYHNPIATCYVMAIANFRWSLITRASATHELFHFVRHIQKKATFEEEYRSKGWRRFQLTIQEERYVWLKSFAVSPVGTWIIGMMWISILLTFVFLLNQYTSMLLPKARPLFGE
jgi:hypothetical protein